MKTQLLMVAFLSSSVAMASTGSSVQPKISVAAQVQSKRGALMLQSPASLTLPTSMPVRASLPARISLYVAEGSGAKGGGDVEHCPGGSDVLTDLNPSSPQGTIVPYDDYSFADDQTLLMSTLEFMDQAFPADAVKIRQILGNLRFVEVKDIDSLDTGAKVGWFDRIFGWCSRQQVAIQDLQHQVVTLKKSSYDRMTPLMKALLKVHEAYISLESASAPDLKTLETQARAKVSELYNAPGFAHFVLADALKRMNREPGDIERILTPGFENLFGDLTDDPSEKDEVNAMISVALPSYIDAGLDPNGTYYCQLPIVSDLLLHSIGMQCDPNNVSYCAPDHTPTDVALALVDRGARLDAKDIAGAEPIFYAELREHREIRDWGDAPELVTDLVQKGAEVNAAWCQPGTHQGALAVTPLDLAERMRDKDIEKELLSLNAKTAADLYLTCPEVPPITPAQLKAADCVTSTGDVQIHDVLYLDPALFKK